MIANAATYGIGWSIKQVKIRELDPVRRIARCVDTEGQVLDVATSFHRTGIRPQAGQVWLVDRELSAWTLRALWEIGEPLPVPAVTSDWRPVTLSNSWVKSSNADDPEPSARVTADGWIELSGVTYNGTVPPVGSPLAVAALPSGFPGNYRSNLNLASHMPTTGTGYVRGSLLVGGVVSIQIATAYTPTWIDLTGLRARVKEA